MLAYKGLPSLQWAVFVGFERKNAHRSRPLEIIGLSKVSTYLPRQMNHPPLGVYQKQLALWAVLMDTWYATKDLLLQIEGYGKIYYCPLKDNRLVDDSGGTQPYRRLDSLTWSAAKQQHGKIIKIKGLPAQHKVKVFRVVLSAFGAAHGLCRHQRDSARQRGGRPRCVRLPLESRAISPRNQTIDRARKLSVP